MNIKRHKTFLKDFKKTKLADSQFEKCLYYLNLIRENKALPAEARDHGLHGNFQDCRELHLGGDTLIIYLIKDGEAILLRIGTRSQLFK